MFPPRPAQAFQRAALLMTITGFALLEGCGGGGGGGSAAVPPPPTAKAGGVAALLETDADVK